jgi:aspartate/methionine/tyrosine aminotransferase
MSKEDISEKMLKLRPSGIRKMFDLAQGVPDIISLGIGQPDFETPEYIKDAMKEALDKNYTSYSPNMGYVELREAIINKYKDEYDLNYSVNDIIVTCGACEALFIICQALLNPGDDVLTPDPGFLTYPAQVLLASGKPVSYQISEEDNFDIEIEEIKNKITPKTKMIILNFPSNPTGAVMQEDELSALIKLLDEKNIFILSDECYEKLVYDNFEHICSPSLGAKDKTFVINSFSKTYSMIGWRVGYLLAPTKFVKYFNTVHQMNTASANSAAQMACVAALNNKKEGKKFVSYMVSEFDKRRKYVYENINKIEGISCKPTKGAFYYLINIKDTGLTSQEFSELMIKEAKVVTVPGDEFGDNGEGYARIAYTCEIKKLEEALDRIKRTLNG